MSIVLGLIGFAAIAYAAYRLLFADKESSGEGSGSAGGAVKSQSKESRK